MTLGAVSIIEGRPTYHPNNRMGLDSIDHAGHPGNWWALATDTGTPRGRPVLQGENDPAPGYYVTLVEQLSGLECLHD
jgi:hypothetical protein